MAEAERTLGTVRRAPAVALIAAGRGVRRRRALASGLAGGVVGVLGALAACGTPGAGGEAPGANTPPVTIEYLTALSPRQEDNKQQLLIDPFEKAHPNIRLTITNWGTFPEKLVTLVTAGTPPDVTWFAYPEQYLGKLVQEITQYVKRDKYNLNVWPKALFDAICAWRGKVIGLPNQGGGNWPVMPYNQELFRQAGLPEPPVKWGDPKWNGPAFLDALQKTTKRGGDGKAVSFGVAQPGPGYVMYNYPGQWDAAWLSDDYKTVTCDSPQLVEAYEYLVGLVTRQKVMVPTAQVRDELGETNALNAFLNGKLAVYQASAAQTANISTAVKEQNAPFAYAPLPLFKAVNAAVNVDDNGLPTGVKHPEQAWAYVKWSADTPNWSISRGTPVSRADLFDAWVKELYPSEVATKMRFGVFRDAYQNVKKLEPLTNLPGYSDLYKNTITPAFDKMWSGAASVAQALREIKPAIQAFVPKDLP
jgi:multiple sugar transport system substrate-binding protein